MPSWHTTQNVNTLPKLKHMMLGAIRIDKNRHICPRLLPKCTPLQRYENWDLSMSSLSSGARSLAANLARKAEMHFLFSNTAFRAADLVRHVRTSPKISAWHYNTIVCLSRKVRLQCYQFWNKSCKIHSVSLSFCDSVFLSFVLPTCDLVFFSGIVHDFQRNIFRHPLRIRCLRRGSHWLEFV